MTHQDVARPAAGEDATAGVLRNTGPRLSGAKTVLGLAGLAFGAFVLVASLQLPMGEGFRMGPGLMPAVLACLIMVLSLVKLLTGLRGGRHAGTISIRQPLLVVLGLLIFGALMAYGAGLAIASMTSVIVSLRGGSRVSWRESIVVAVVLSAAAILIFPIGLGQPLRIWP